MKAEIITIFVSLLVGAAATTIAEYKFGYNLADKLIDLSRSEEQKLQLLEQRAATAATHLRQAISNKVESIAKKIG